MTDQHLPKKKWGQNFLTSQFHQQKIQQFLEKFLFYTFVQNNSSFHSLANPIENILEIGPGTGLLTDLILESLENLEKKYKSKQKKQDFCLELWEIDPDLVLELEKKFSQQKKIKISQTDARTNFAKNQLPKNFSLISALPYNIASRILMDLCLNSPETPFLVIVQKEVAKKCLNFDIDLEKSRLEATKIMNQNNFSAHSNFSLFGGFISIFFETKILLDLPPSAFWPQPKVTSSLLLGIPKNPKTLFNKTNQILERQEILQNLKKLSQNRRKKLSHIFKHYFPSLEQEKKPDFQKIAEQRLDWNNFQTILGWL